MVWQTLAVVWATGVVALALRLVTILRALRSPGARGEALVPRMAVAVRRVAHHRLQRLRLRDLC